MGISSPHPGHANGPDHFQITQQDVLTIVLGLVLKERIRLQGLRRGLEIEIPYVAARHSLPRNGLHLARMLKEQEATLLTAIDRISRRPAAA